MPQAKKTILVEDMKKHVNESLATSRVDTPEAVNLRLGMCLLLETMLLATNNYRGFRYLTAYDLPGGVRPGVRPADSGTPEEQHEARFKDTDPSRRAYH